MENTQLIDSYIESFPTQVQEILQNIRNMIHELAPEAQEAIKYGIPTFVLNGNLVHFAAYKKHIGFYPTPSGIENFMEELSPYKVSKGAIQFPLNKPIPYDLIRKITLNRIENNLKNKSP